MKYKFKSVLTDIQKTSRLLSVKYKFLFIAAIKHAVRRFCADCKIIFIAAVKHAARRFCADYKLLFIAALIFPVSFFSCNLSANKNQSSYFLADRHGLSYEPVKDCCIKNKIETLVLFDWHNDVKDDSGRICSYNWVGRLLEHGYINKVYWICQSSADKIQLNSNRAWLEKNCRNKDEQIKDKILNAFEIIDFNSLENLKIKEPYIITIDLDLYDVQTEKEPLLFIQKTCSFLKNSKCPLVTFSFSAAYQSSPQKAWSYLQCFLQNAPQNVNWYFKSGQFGEKAESNEDLNAFEKWKKHIEVYQAYQLGFYRGAYLWLNAPPFIQDLMLKKKMQPLEPDDDLSRQLLSAIEEKRQLEKDFIPYSQKQKLEELSAIALSRLKDENFCDKPDVSSIPFTDKNSRGIAVRYRNINNDRGCLSLYSGVNNFNGAAGYCSFLAARDPRYDFIKKEELNHLFINISLFSYWEKMSSYEDFIPGLDSLIVVNPNTQTEEKRITLLQASLANERGYSKEAFLQRLFLKAALQEDAFKNKNLIFYKSKTISYTAPLK